MLFQCICPLTYLYAALPSSLNIFLKDNQICKTFILGDSNLIDENARWCFHNSFRVIGNDFRKDAYGRKIWTLALYLMKIKSNQFLT